MAHETYMKTALSLAKQGRGWTSPNPLVGAVVIKSGKVVGRGFHQKAGGPHAEVYALKEAGENAKNATLYVTLEPCNHTGRTPPCTELILKSGIKRVVVGMKDPNPGVTGGGLDFLKNQGLDIIVGVCKNECQRVNESFIKYITTGIPLVMLKCAATLDGLIATRTGDSKWITNAESRQFVHKLRHAVDAIMVGVGTVNKDDPRLTTRLDNLKGSDPVRIILDTHLSISPDAKLLHLSSASDSVIVTNPPVAREKRRLLEKAGVQILVMDSSDDQIDLMALVKKLGRMNITSLLIEGGSKVNGSALRSGIVDKIYMFLAPLLCGGDGVPICSGPGVEFMKESIRVEDISIHRFEDDMMVEGYLKGM